MRMPFTSFLILRGSMYSENAFCRTYYETIYVFYRFHSLVEFVELIIASRDRQQVWIRLIINALETNFFLYSSDQRMNYINMMIIH